jgi:hypothetical protein
MSSPQIKPVDPNPPGWIDETELEPGHYGKPFILNRVFNLLVLMIDVLQRTSAAQANRLNFLTQWQKAYTDELNQIHSFVANNGDGQIEPPRVDDPNNTRAGSARADMNSQNSIWTQQIQGNLNIISNDAKALQANVNQSSDAVQSQSDMATSILQQLSTILTSIYSSS